VPAAGDGTDTHLSVLASKMPLRRLPKRAEIFDIFVAQITPRMIVARKTT
jgi:hypothetical protein